MPELITAMGGSLHGTLVADAGTAMVEPFRLARTAFPELFGSEGVCGAMASFDWNLVTHLPRVLDAAFDLAVTLILMMLLR